SLSSRRQVPITAWASALVASVVLLGTVVAGAASAPVTPVAPATPAQSVLAPESGSYVFTLTFDGMQRDYRLHVPPAASASQPLPLVLNLHGATQNAQLEEITSGMDPNSDQNGYLVAYPDGTRIAKVLTPDPVAKNAQYGWNAGQCCGLPVTKHINDVGFLLKVIADIAAKTQVNLRRVYMTGISNGGMMAYAMAAEASGHLAAISSISGQVEIPVIHPTRVVPTMEFHSVNDPIAKYNGTPSKNPLLRLSVMQGVDQWVKADGCSAKPHTGTVIVGAAGSISAGETATPIAYTHCRSGAEVALWRFTGSGHVWPGSPLNTGPKKSWILAGVGRGIVLVNANEAMWQFFEKYSLPSTAR
ncbi:MAG TPA: PHB depolymerase family esterase, partial [Acidimicrobiales bacterium]|nr:PHB depolymerase family esterase [Acidimicrobiales bacterium]